MSKSLSGDILLHLRFLDPLHNTVVTYTTCGFFKLSSYLYVFYHIVMMRYCGRLWHFSEKNNCQLYSSHDLIHTS